MKCVENWKSEKQIFFTLPLYLASGLKKFSTPVRYDTCDSVVSGILAHGNAVDNVFKYEFNCFR